ncbi:NAD(P)H-binding [Cognatiyoonia sediminum]|uniref:NAD(P)H-binding n=1 Tax=Cognatiyoonia sediminum TaxID=1508389 RepID=A0A1M5S2H6_9RHOB|nr:NAD(P)H-binding protein [Cognatiyoonia sediminum]SHH32719.1 NAD(P)H-binding [Cognatiyoonia sediminum]
MKKVCIIGISGKLGQYMTQHCLDLGYEVVGVCRPQSVHKLDRFKDQITVFPGRTDDRAVVQQAVKGCDGVLTVLAPWGVNDYASGTAQAVMDFAEPDARLIFSCGWHITKDGKDTYGLKIRSIVWLFSWLGPLLRLVDLNDQVEATNRIFASDRLWTVVRGSDLEEGESDGLPVWAEHVGDPVLASNMTKRIDFALFMVHALRDDRLIHQAPAIVGRNTASAKAELLHQHAS